MPLLTESSYRPPRFFTNGHVQTVYPTLFRKVQGVVYSRRRITTPDQDFLDLDYSSIGSSKVAVVLHGLEGDSARGYIKGMVRSLNRGGWDAIALNFRGCSGEPNRQRRFYHSGETGDLHHVLSWVMEHDHYSEFAMVGFSLGGNVTLKYLGEQGSNITPPITKAVAFSVPCDLASSSAKLERISNRLYLRRFLRMLEDKVRVKKALMPDKIDDRPLDGIKTFRQFDDRYTAPVHGFADARDYWERASCRPFLSRIAVPTLLVSAADDPFLAPECYPYEEAKASSHFFMEVPRSGGHVGFVSFNPDGIYWSEKRALAFLNGNDPL